MAWKREIVEPTVTVYQSGPRQGEKTLSHPAFGMISVHKISGGNAVMFGSDFHHHHYVRLEIKPAELQRGLSTDWYHSGSKYHIAVEMSEAQWATFVSSFNTSGVPCTTRYIGMECIPEFPLRDEGQEYKVEVDSKLADTVNQLNKLRDSLEAGAKGLPKKKAAELLLEVNAAIRNLQGSLPFIAECFGEHMEKRVEKAKVEVNAYMTNAVMHAGLQVLQKDMPLLLEKEENE